MHDIMLKSIIFLLVVILVVTFVIGLIVPTFTLQKARNTSEKFAKAYAHKGNLDVPLLKAKLESFGFTDVTITVPTGLAWGQDYTFKVVATLSNRELNLISFGNVQSVQKEQVFTIYEQDFVYSWFDDL